MKRAIVAVLCLPLMGCFVQEAGPERTDRKSIPMDQTEMVTAELKMGAGELEVNTGTSQLFDAAFIYNVDAWKPEVRYNALGFRGHLTVEQAKEVKVAGNGKNRWELNFNEGKPLELIVKLGAGEAKMDLGSADIRGIEVHMGVGELDLDLRGTPKRSYNVRVNGGVGEATVRLPRDVGVIAYAKGGIGSINVQGLRREGDRYVNDAYRKSRTRVTVDIKGGVGEIKLIAD